MASLKENLVTQVKIFFSIFLCFLSDGIKETDVPNTLKSAASTENLGYCINITLWEVGKGRHILYSRQEDALFILYTCHLLASSHNIQDNHIQ